MIDEPEIVRARAEATAVIRIEVPRAEIQRVMEPAILGVLEVLCDGPSGWRTELNRPVVEGD